MGALKSTRWPLGYERKLAVEDCRRINGRESQAMGLPVALRVMGRGVSWRFCLCAGCGRTPKFLYERPETPNVWRCRWCHDLEYLARLEKGTRAAMERAANQASGSPAFERWLRRQLLWNRFDELIASEIQKRRPELRGEALQWVLD